MSLRVLCLLRVSHMTGCEGRAKQCIHQRHCCCPSSSCCPSPSPPCTYSVLLLSVTKEERKGRRHWPCKSFLTTTSYLKSSWPFSCCSQMLVLRHSALVSLLVFHFKYLFSRPQSSVKHLYFRSCGKYEFWVLRLPSLLAYLPTFSSGSLHFLLPLSLLALTDYNLNLLPGRDSLGNNTKSFCGKLCDFTTNFNHFCHYFSSWWKVEESDVIGKKSEDWLDGWRASNAELQAQTTTFCSAINCLSHFPWYTSHFKICNTVQASKRSLGWIISCTHITLSFGKYTKWSSQEKLQNKLE